MGSMIAYIQLYSHYQPFRKLAFVWAHWPTHDLSIIHDVSQDALSFHDSIWSVNYTILWNKRNKPKSTPKWSLTTPSQQRTQNPNPNPPSSDPLTTSSSTKEILTPNSPSPILLPSCILDLNSNPTNQNPMLPTSFSDLGSAHGCHQSPSKSFPLFFASPLVHLAVVFLPQLGSLNRRIHECSWF